MNFSKHISFNLINLFKEKPYQGQSPEQAKIIFLSSDANYSKEISEHPFFNRILEYHEDGVKFWHKYGVHHPFLLSDYPFKKNQGGVPFHKRFSAIGLDSSYAEDICFLELLNTPTIGSMSKDKTEFLNLIDLEHLKYIDHLITNSDGKLFFVSKNVADLLHDLKKRYDIFNWLQSCLKEVNSSQKVGNNKILVIYHFSASVSNQYRKDLKVLIDNWFS